MRRTTLKDIAESVGLSVSCTARALKGRREISAATRARVQAAAERLGYAPDPMLAALSVYRQSRKPAHYQGTLAFLTTRRDEQEWLKSRETGDLLRGARQRAEALGYRLEYFNIGKSRASQEKIWKILRARGIRGALIRSFPVSPEELHLPLQELTCVDLFSTPHQEYLPTVSSHHVQSMKLVLHELHQRGYQRPALILRRELSESLHHGWLMAFTIYASRFALASTYLYEEGDDGFSPLVRWINRRKTDALIYCSSENSLPALRKTPGFSSVRTSVISMDVLDPECGTPGIYQDRHRGGSVSVEWLQGMLLTNQTGTPSRPNTLLIPGAWIEGMGLRKSPSDGKLIINETSR